MDQSVANEDLYSLLGIPKATKDEDVKKAYYKQALKYHPDKCSDEHKREEMTQMFQKIGFAYAILSDKKKRKIYDTTGKIEKEDMFSSDRDWEEYWRTVFPKITLNDIKKFELEYKGSKEEEEDLKKAYMDHKGSMDKIIGDVYLGSFTEEERYRKIIQTLIDQKKLPALKLFSEESAKKKKSRQKRAAQEEREADELAAELGLKATNDSIKDLGSLIRSRQNDRMNNLISNLEEKYKKPKKLSK